MINWGVYSHSLDSLMNANGSGLAGKPGFLSDLACSTTKLPVFYVYYGLKAIVDIRLWPQG